MVKTGVRPHLWPMLRVALLGQLATTLPLVGLIWMVQVVAYPLFSRVSESSFPAYHAAHSALITVIVGPLMMGELACACLFLLARPTAVASWEAWAGLGLVAVAWLTTAFLSVPQHNLLARGFDAGVHDWLVLTNWIRTVSWTARGLWLVWVLDRLTA